MISKDKNEQGMNKTHKTKPIRNIHDLHLEQARVRHAYKDMERNAISSIITPDAVLSLVLNSFIAPKSKKRTAYPESEQKPKSLLSSFFRRKKTVTATTSKDFSKKIGVTKKNYKKLGRSLLIWQAASLGIFIGIHVFRYYQKQKTEKGIRNRKSGELSDK